jgi:hypothetical protein
VFFAINDSLHTHCSVSEIPLATLIYKTPGTNQTKVRAFGGADRELQSVFAATNGAACGSFFDITFLIKPWNQEFQPFIFRVSVINSRYIRFLSTAKPIG